MEDNKQNSNEELNNSNSGGSNQSSPAQPQFNAPPVPPQGAAPAQPQFNAPPVPPQGAPQYGNVPPQGAPQYGNVPPQAQYNQPMKKETDILAILSLVAAFIFSPVAIVLGHISLSRIKKGDRGGRGIAMAGLVLGYVFTAISILWVVLVIILAASGALDSSVYYDDLSTY